MRQTNIFTHLAAAAIVTILAGLIYAAVQQVYRSGANDPQIQTARDISDKLENAGTVGKWFDSDTIDISRSLAVFQTLYNDKNEPVVSTGVLNNRMPSLPTGVFSHAMREENVFTWQPQHGVRIAIVLRSLQSSSYSYVAVGRSLREVERREENMVWMVLLSWLLCMGVIMIHWVITFLKTGRSLNK